MKIHFSRELSIISRHVIQSLRSFAPISTIEHFDYTGHLMFMLDASKFKHSFVSNVKQTANPATGIVQPGNPSNFDSRPLNMFKLLYEATYSR